MRVPEHRQEFQRELDGIEAKVIELFAMIAEDLAKATGALLSGDNGVIALLAERERAIDALYQEIEGLEAYAKLSLKKYSPTAARNDDLKVFSGRR